MRKLGKSSSKGSDKWNHSGFFLCFFFTAQQYCSFLIQVDNPETLTYFQLSKLVSKNVQQNVYSLYFKWRNARLPIFCNINNFIYILKLLLQVSFQTYNHKHNCHVYLKYSLINFRSSWSFYVSFIKQFIHVHVCRKFTNRMVEVPSHTRQY